MLREFVRKKDRTISGLSAERKLESTENHRAVFLEGLEAGVPIGLGYFAVSFSLGIAARDCGFTAFQGFISSLFTYASAGQYIGFTNYAAGGSLITLILLTVITNLRYLLMGFALNQRMPAGTALVKRVLVCSCITDEIFGVTIARPGIPTPWFTFGALTAAVPCWAVGTALGISMGSILPGYIVSALSVALYGMFLACTVPYGRKDKAVAAAIAVSYACSLACEYIPGIRDLSSGTRLTILAIGISALFAWLCPRDAEVQNEA